MFRKLAFVMVGLGLFVSLPASAQELQYVGNSAITTKGGAGVAALTGLCFDEFGAGARICTSEEVLLSTEPLPVDANADPQWVLATFVSGAFKIFDTSGIEGQPHTLSCLGWRSNSSSYQGLTVSDVGSFERKGCNVLRQVACCQVVP